MKRNEMGREIRIAAARKTFKVGAEFSSFALAFGFWVLGPQAKAKANLNSAAAATTTLKLVDR